MENTDRLNFLKEKFDKLKNTCARRFSYNNSWALDPDKISTLTEKLIAPVLKLDRREGVRMWLYLLRHYYKKIEDKSTIRWISDDIIKDSEEEDLTEAFLGSDALCDLVFRRDPADDGQINFVKSLILRKQFELADKLISLMLQNEQNDPSGQDNLFELLKRSYDAGRSIDEDHIAYLSKWIPRLENPLQKDEIELFLLHATDLVNGRKETDEDDLFRFSISLSVNDLSLSSEGERDGTDKAEKPADGGKTGEKKGKKPLSPDPGALEACKKELNELIGLSAVKEDVNTLINLIKVNKIRKERGLVVPETTKHLVFTGNPGTGKTTIARILGRMYHALGLLSKGHYVEVDRSGLVAGYVGQTAIKTKEVIDKARGGVLFIDEAYSLSVPDAGNDFGSEAIETLLKAMEDKREDLIVIVAGYHDLMERFIHSNPGLKSRFNKYIFFPDYTGEELMQIFALLLKKNQYTVTDSAERLLQNHFGNLVAHKPRNFGNGREVRNIFERLIAIQANRIASSAQIADEALSAITEEDVKTLLEKKAAAPDPQSGSPKQAPFGEKTVFTKLGE